MINNQYARATLPLSQQQQQQQILSSQQNVLLADNAVATADLMQGAAAATTTQLNEAMYYAQSPQFNISNTMGPPQQHYQNPHSLLASISGHGTNGAGIYDSNFARMFNSTTASAANSIENSTHFLRNNLNATSMPSQTNTILIDSFAPQLQQQSSQQLEQPQQLYRSTAQLTQHYPNANLQQQLQQHSNAARQQLRRLNEAAQAQQQIQRAVTTDTTQTMHQLQQQEIPASTHHSIYLPADAFAATVTSNGKMSAYLPFKVNTTFPNSTLEMYQRQLQTAAAAATVSASHPTLQNANSPVVLDRINICINNHYAEPNFCASPPPVIDTNATAEIPSLSSPIIPTIQHSAVIDPHLLLEPPANHLESSTNNMATTPVASTVNEPDSTTASHTPPTTPVNLNNTAAAALSVNAIQSPSTSSSTATKVDEFFKDSLISLSETNNAKSSPENSPTNSEQHFEATSLVAAQQSLTPLPAEQENLTETSIAADVADPAIIENVFSIGDDVFVRIDVDSLYLGTVVDAKYQKYRVRFDDATEMWCSHKDMRLFGDSHSKTTPSPCSVKKSTNADGDAGTLCVACKKRDFVDVEICERCGRGYHRACTTETSAGSGEWLCKRCAKSMKIQASEICEDFDENFQALSPTSQQQQQQAQRQLPYNVKSLHWDSKHRVNDEQIYCYCGRSGQFDFNMLQCCKCLNWYHGKCLEHFKSPIMMRGDCFFIFCCAICNNDGKEFLRRLQINCVDFMHLVLYNLSTQKKHQQNKYHHLTKHILPFVLEQQQAMALPDVWQQLTEAQLKDCIQTTLKKHTERFVCGRELKRDHYYYGLRHHNGPPLALQKDQHNICREAAEINDEFIVAKLQMKFAKQTIEENEASTIDDNDNENDNNDDTDGKFTSDDEIPIKLVLEKEKDKNKADDEHDQENRLATMEAGAAAKATSSTTTTTKVAATTKSHKRKAFTLSRPRSALVGLGDHHTTNIFCDSSSDENSSSSRGTSSLDLIIPPPKNFLGANNPFSTAASATNLISKAISKTLPPPLFDGGGGCGGNGRRSLFSGGPAIRNSVVNATTFDFCSNLAVLKNAGMLPNLNTTNFARAAGQPRMVRTIKRRLSAKDIMIGPNQEIRRRRTRRLSTNVEIISETTINPLSSFFPINISTGRKSTSTSTSSSKFTTSSNNTATTATTKAITQEIIARHKSQTATHGGVRGSNNGVGRRLRLRHQTTNSLPTASSNSVSRRSSLSGASTTSSISSSSGGNAATQTHNNAAVTQSSSSSAAILSDLHQTVNKYFGVGHLLDTGEQFSLHAKRQLPNGQIQLLIEWGGNDENSFNADHTNIGTDTGEQNSTSQAIS